jgi:transcription-repair coupling factor (superfamily II helicase)
VRVEFWGDEVTEMRMFSVADQRSITEIAVEHLVAVPCREPADRGRPGPGGDARRRAAADGEHRRRRRGHAGQAGRGHPVDGMEALLPVLRADDLVLLTDQLPPGRRCWCAIRRRCAPVPPT